MQMADDKSSLEGYADALRSSREKRAQPSAPPKAAGGQEPEPVTLTELEPRHLPPLRREAAVSLEFARFVRHRYRQAATVLVPAYLLIASLMWVKFHILWGWCAAGLAVGLALLVLDRFVIRGKARADAERAVQEEEERYNARRVALPKMLDRAEALLTKRDYMGTFDLMMEAQELIGQHVAYVGRHYADDLDPGDDAIVARARELFRALTKQGDIPPDRIREF